MNSGIYKMEFPRGEFYIGQSINLGTRWDEHQKDFLMNRAARKLQVAYNMNLGVAHFTVMLNCHPDYLDMFEAYFIHALRPQLNTNYPKPDRYNWEAVSYLLQNSSTFDPIEKVLNTYKEVTADLRSCRVEITSLEEQLDKVGYYADEQEARAIDAENQLKDPEIINKLRAELKAARDMYRALDEVFWERMKAINTFNKLPWYKKMRAKL